MTPSWKHEKEPFLPNDSDEAQDEQSRHHHSRWHQYKTHSVFLLVQLVFLTVNIGLLVWNVQPQKGSAVLESIDQRTYSPVTSAVPYEVSTIDLYESGTSSPFIGQPRPELDQAWSNLLRSTNLRITEDEMLRMNKTSVALRDGSGYVGYLEANHMLHCLKRFKQYRHLDHYTGVDQSTFALPHWDHCIEVIRQGIMCNADLSIDTVVWKNDKEMQGVSAWPRKCKNWDAVEAWADARVIHIDPKNPGGTVMLNNEGGEIGPVDLLR